jgi:hypothetical protein
LFSACGVLAINVLFLVISLVCFSTLNVICAHENCD